MNNRKISASYIFAGNKGFLKNGILSLTNDGQVLNLINTGGNLIEEANLEHYNGIVCPGFINTHCHLELSHLRGKIPRNTQLAGFAEAIIARRKASREDITLAITEAEREIREEGIVAVADICNTSDTFETKSRSSVFYHSFVEVFGTSAVTAHSIYSKGQNLVREARQKFSLKANITPHSAYSLGENLFTLLREGIDADDLILSIHNQEAESENDLVRNANGMLYDTFLKLGFDMSSFIPRNKNSFPWLMEQLPGNKRYLMVHNLYTNEDDLSSTSIENADIYWVLCPKSNYYIGETFPGKYLIERFSDRICIGTDSLASNDRLSVLQEIFALQITHPEIPLAELLKWSTINGAKALNIDNWCGSFEEGKKPGVVLIENADILNLKLKKDSRVRVLV